MKVFTAALLMGGSLILGGCQQKERQDQQVVASGKSFEVTIPEFDQLLRKSPEVTKAEVVPARQKVLDVLINQKLFAEAAVEQKMDRDVETMQELEAQRRAVLASAYVSKLFSSVAKPTSREVQVYYDAHPKAFLQRKVYTVTQASIEGDDLPLKEYQASLEGGGMKALDARLAQNGINAIITNVVISSDMLPEKVAAQMEGLAVGSPIIFNTGATIHMGTIAAIQDGSVPLDLARPVIEQRIGQDRRESLIKSQADRLRADRQVAVKSAIVKGAKPQ